MYGLVQPVGCVCGAVRMRIPGSQDTTESRVMMTWLWLELGMKFERLEKRRFVAWYRHSRANGGSAQRNVASAYSDSAMMSLSLPHGLRTSFPPRARVIPRARAHGAARPAAVKGCCVATGELGSARGRASRSCLHHMLTSFAEQERKSSRARVR